MFNDFKEFIKRGNVVDLAVGVIIGTAFSSIVSSVVNDLFMPIVGVILGGLDFSDLNLVVGDSVIYYGNFLNSVIDFVVIAACVFFITVLMNKFLKKEKPLPPQPEEHPKVPEDIELLREIRDLLKKEKNVDKKDDKKEKK